MAQFLGTVQLGGFYNNGTILKRPTKPWRVDKAPTSNAGKGDIPQMLGSMANYTIGDTPSAEANRLQWHKIKDGDKTLFICDRVILVYVSWDDLNEQGYVTGKTVTIDGRSYKCRLITGGSNYRNSSTLGKDSYAGGSPTNNEWDRFITREEVIIGLPVPLSSDLDENFDDTDRGSTHNQFWNWAGIYSLCQETYVEVETCRAYRGYNSARHWQYTTALGRDAHIGFRPVLEVLNTAPTTPGSVTSVTLGSKADGSIIKIKEGGVLTDFCVKQDYEHGLNGTGRVLVVRKDCYDQRQWHGSNVNAYATSAIDTWLNGTYKSLLDADIQAAMGTTKIYYTPGNGTTTKTILQRSVFLLSATELGQTDTYVKVEGTALPSTVLDLLKIAHLNGSTVYQWTRSPHSSGTVGVWALKNDGNLFSNVCIDQAGTRPAFTLPANLWVTYDGTVTTNAPPASTNITIPSQINGGSTITIEWGTSADAEGNLEGYKVERSLDGGTTWTQIYQGTALSTTNTVPFGTDTVMYRVKAYDSEGLESGWKTSSQVTVINNTAPTVPGNITVPEQVQGGQPLAIAWGASSDGENNLAGYSLERQVDGGDWAVVYSGPELSFTDAITKGWQTVAYRVRAYDVHNAYSGFAVSGTREVNNNTPPAITCEYPASSSLGTKSEGFSVAYSVTDEEGDEVTVTEAVDGVTVRTFTAELGEENSFRLDGETFMRLLNGTHTLTITADDGKSSTVHRLTFAKLVTAASITLEQPMAADGPITVCVLSVSGSIPLDAEYTVEVTNNALDDEPVWEDCTAAVRSGINHLFENETAENGFAFNFRLNVERGESCLGGYITSVQGGFQ